MRLALLPVIFLIQGIVAGGPKCSSFRPACPRDMGCQILRERCPSDNNKACPGVCVFTNKYQACGGLAIEMNLCRADEKCVDDPRPLHNCGMACKIPGICMVSEPIRCGGFAGRPCPEGLFCYDFPTPSCDTSKGAVDCLGVCL